MTSPDPKVHTSDLIRPEELAERYAGQWTICHDLNWDGTHGDWEAVACRATPGRPEKITARSIEALADQLAKASR